MNITVYCGANLGKNENFKEKALELANWMVQNGHGLVYGGGKVGLMGVISDAILQQQGKVIGVIPTFLKEKELANLNVSELIVVEDMSTRKKIMIEKGDVFIAMPGGPGTMEEIAEVFSWGKLKLHQSPCIFYNVDGFYNPMKTMYDDMVAAGFLEQKDRELLFFSDDIKEIEHFIQHY